ncbi:MAG: Nif3-like dinuclear metal center hexameric protein [Clostridia bacterium]|nr:Nif3-like dinuclear metal center hexameric protein [Clostridia bacterium]
METSNHLHLDDRLLSAASFVRQGAVAADIGTDHAYLPVYLLQNKIARSAIASDINTGPLERAKASAERYGIRENITFCRSDGLQDIDLVSAGVTDIVICGMGGELIARILDASPYVRNADIHLILQPMTAADDLRAYLDQNGFAVLDEKLSAAAGKNYCCLLAVYDGVKRQSTPAELLLGKRTIEKREPLFEAYADEILHRLEKRINGLKKGALDASAEEACMREIRKILGGSGMTIETLHEKLTEKFPKTLSCSWDNDGIMVSPDTGAEVKKILVALDAAHEVITYARENGFDTVVTHHPMLFRGAKSVTHASLSGRRILDAAMGGISVISLHTRMDAGEDGVNDALVRALGLEPCGVFGDEDSPSLGRITVTDGMTGAALAELVKEKLGCASVRVTGDASKIIKKIGFCGGDGKDFLYPALYAGCDAYITGDSGYNMAQDAAEDGLLTIETGHYHSEAPVLEPLAALLEMLTGIKPEVYNSCAYRVL